MPILASHSPLSRLPLNMEPTQRAFLDGIRIAIEMVDISYVRLCATLYSLTMKTIKKVLTTEQPGQNIAGAMLDAWAIVDSIHRLRELVDRLPQMKRKKPSYLLFREKTSKVHDLRNCVQHLKKEILRLVKENEPVWGRLSWFTVTSRIPPAGFFCMAISGTITPGKHPPFGPLQRVVHVPVDLVTLHAYGINLDISGCMDAVNTLAKGFEEKLGPQFEGLPCGGADFVVAQNIIGKPSRGKAESQE